MRLSHNLRADFTTMPPLASALEFHVVAGVRELLVDRNDLLRNTRALAWPTVADRLGFDIKDLGITTEKPMLRHNMADLRLPGAVFSDL